MHALSAPRGVLLLAAAIAAFTLGDCHGMQSQRDRQELIAARDSLERVSLRIEAAEGDLRGLRNAEHRARASYASLASGTAVAVQEWEAEALSARAEAEEAQERLSGLLEAMDAPEELLRAHTEVIASLEHEISSVRAQRDLLSRQLTSSESLASARLSVIRGQQNVIVEQRVAIAAAEEALALALSQARRPTFSWEGRAGTTVKLLGAAAAGYALARSLPS